MEYRLHLLLLLLHCLYFLSIKRNRLTSLWIKIAVIYEGEYMDGLLRGFFSIDAVLHAAAPLRRGGIVSLVVASSSCLFLDWKWRFLGFFPAGVAWCILARNMFISRV